MLGLDPWRVLSEEDPFTYAVMEAVINLLTTEIERRDDVMATRIANAIWKGVKIK